MQSSARQRVKWLKCKRKPTLMEGFLGREGPAWSCGRAEALPFAAKRLFQSGCTGALLSQSQHVQKEGADGGTRLLPCPWRDAEPTKWFLKATSTRTNVCQDNTVLPSQELLPSRNVWDAAKVNEMSAFAASANGHHGPQPFGVASAEGTREGKCSAWKPSGEQNLLLLFGGRKLWQRL